VGVVSGRRFLDVNDTNEDGDEEEGGTKDDDDVADDVGDEDDEENSAGGGSGIGSGGDNVPFFAVYKMLPPVVAALAVSVSIVVSIMILLG